MGSTLKLLAVLFMFVSSAAYAADHGRGKERHGGYGAPEPVTMVGLALGATAIGGAAWRKWRKR